MKIAYETTLFINHRMRVSDTHVFVMCSTVNLFIKRTFLADFDEFEISKQILIGGANAM